MPGEQDSGRERAGLLVVLLTHGAVAVGVAWVVVSWL